MVSIISLIGQNNDSMIEVNFAPKKGDLITTWVMFSPPREREYIWIKGNCYKVIANFWQDNCHVLCIVEKVSYD